MDCLIGNDDITAREKNVKHKFKPEEDAIIIRSIQENGFKSWTQIAKLIPSRTPRQVRERYVNYLNPYVNHQSWTKEEDQIILDMVSRIGKSWTKIAHSIKGRTDVMIKNRYLLLQRRKAKENQSQTIGNLRRPSTQATTSQIPLMAATGESFFTHSTIIDTSIMEFAQDPDLTDCNDPMP